MKKAVKIVAMVISTFMGINSAHADIEFKFSKQPVEQCLKTANGIDRLKYIGVSSGLCMKNNEGGESTLGMSYCLSLEGDVWDEKLNTAYKALLKREKSEDLELDGLESFAPKKVPALIEMQRAWINYRDALCEHEVVQWGGGTGSGPAYAACTERETARQFFVLEDRLNYAN